MAVITCAVLWVGVLGPLHRDIVHAVDHAVDHDVGRVGLTASGHAHPATVRTAVSSRAAPAGRTAPSHARSSGVKQQR